MAGLRQIVGFLGLAVVLVIGLNALSRVLGPPDDEARISRELASARNRPLVLIGASTAHGIIPDRLCQRAGAFRSAGDIFEAEAAVEHFLAAPSRPQTWIVVAAPGITRSDSGSRAGYGADHRKAFYRALYADGYRGMIASDWRNLVSALTMPALGDRAWRKHAELAASYFGQGSPSAKAPAGAPMPMGRRSTAASMPQWAAANAEIRAAEGDRIAYYDGALPQRVASTFGRLARRIRQSGGTLVIVAPPVSDASLAELRRRHGGIEEEYAAAIERARGEGALNIDTLSVSGISDRPDLFTDPEHLNQWGAAKYSDLLARKLFGNGTMQVSPALCGKPGILGGAR